MGDPKKAPQTPDSESERSRFAKKLVNVPKKEIDEKAKEWKRRGESPQRPREP